MISEDIYQTFDLQLDKEGFVKSFNLETATQEELSQFYHKYGILIFNDVLNEKQIELTINDLWNSTTTYYKDNYQKKIDRKDPKSWGQLRGFHKAYGFVGDSIIEQPQIWLNRKNPKVYSAFKKAYQAYGGKELSQPLIANFDRGSMMLPSKINPQWQTLDIYHFDIDPWSWTGQTNNRHSKYDYDPDRISLLLGQGNYDPFVGYTKFAGVLALSDTNENSGGFSCACGFQNYIKKWCEKNKLYTHIEEDKNLLQNFRKIFMRKGSLLIFTRELPHNIYQNKSENFRYAQYLRMSPLSSLCLTPELVESRKKLIKMILPKNMDFSDAISQQIFMLDGQQKDTLKEKTEEKQKKENKNSQLSIEKVNDGDKKWRCMMY